MGSGISLDTGLIIGIAVDLVLAIIVFVLVYWWRIKVNDRKRQERLHKYTESQRTRNTSVAYTDESLDVREAKEDDSKQIHPVFPVKRGTASSLSSVGLKGNAGGDEERRVDGNFAFLQQEGPQPQYDNTANDDNNLRRSKVTFSEGKEEGVERESVPYVHQNAEKVVRNPLSASITDQTTQPGEVVEPEPLAVTTYYTYIDPSEVKDDDLPEPPSTFPIDDQGEVTPIESEYRVTSHSPDAMMLANPAYEGGSDEEEEEEEEGNVNSETRSASINFPDESHAKFYNMELEISTDIV